MNLAIIGCGYVADLYLASLPNHRGLRVTGVYDRDPDRLRQFAGYHKLLAFPTLEHAVSAPDVELVINLTSPRSHSEVSRRALEAGKHVYSEKPLAMSLDEGRELAALAARRGLSLASAPCTVLGEAAQTVWRELRLGRIGSPRLVFAELSDGPVPLMNPSGWKNNSGAAWPVQDEFEVGCTLEHAGYYVTWLTAFFGPVQRLSVFGTTLLPDKGLPAAVQTPDFTVGLLEFRSGIVARLTCDIYASHDHRLRIFGDAGVLLTDDCWDMGSPVRFSPRSDLHLQRGLRSEHFPPNKWQPWFRPQRVPLVRKPSFAYGGSRGANRIDFMRGVAEVAAAAQTGRPSPLPVAWSLHVLEVVLALGLRTPATKCFGFETTFDALEPMPWAR